MTVVGSQELSDEQAFDEFLRTGDNQFIDVIFARYVAELEAHLSRNYIKNDDHLAEDAVQHAFLKLLKHKKPFVRPYSLRKWLFKVAANHAVNVFESVEVRQAFTIVNESREQGSDRKADRQPEDYRPAQEAEALLRESRLNEIWTRAEGLSDNERNALRLVFQDGLSYKEAAGQLGLSVSTLGTHIHRAIGQLRRSLLKMPELAAA